MPRSQYNRASRIYESYCQSDSDSEKDKLAVSDYVSSKKLVSEKLTHKQNCKLVDAYRFKSKRCCPNGVSVCSREDKGVCCQAITQDGTRCTRKANKWTSIDLTTTTGMITLPEILVKRIGDKRAEELMLLGTGKQCCFFCWQHMGMYAMDIATWASNLTYYTTHPEDILDVFFNDVKVKKYAKLMTYSIELGKPREISDVIAKALKLKAATLGAFTGMYWILQAVVFAFTMMVDTLKKYGVYNHIEVALYMAETSTRLLLRSEDEE